MAPLRDHQAVTQLGHFLQPVLSDDARLDGEAAGFLAVWGCEIRRSWAPDAKETLKDTSVLMELSDPQQVSWIHNNPLVPRASKMGL